MKEFIKSLLLYLLISYFVLSIIDGIFLPSNFGYLLASLTVFSIGMLIATPLLNFLTIKQNFITNLLMSTIICTGVLYLQKTFMIDFYIEGTTFNELVLGSVVIKSFEMLPIVVMVVSAFIASFISSIFLVLEKSK